jgi:putative phosphoesterase
MRIALLSDAHGNPLGVAACLSAAHRLSAEEIWFLGDAVGYLPGECEVLELLDGAGARCQQGNHDAMVLGHLAASAANEEVYMHRSAVSRLGSAGLSVLESWPEKRALILDRKRILAVHGSPSNPLEGYCYPQTDLSSFEELPYDVIVMGHTHRPFIRQAGPVLVINAGSCGLPRDQGDAPSFAMYDSETNLAEVYRIRVDPQLVLQKFRDYPIHDAVKKCLYRTAPQLTGDYVGGI